MDIDDVVETTEAEDHSEQYDFTYPTYSVGVSFE
jgi:hypothetical protein